MTLALPRTLGGKLLLGVVAAAAVGVWSVWGVQAPTRPPRPRTVHRTLDVTVGWNATVVRVTNNGADGVGQPIEIYVNGEPPFAFRADTTVPPQGLFVAVPLQQFVNRNGDRFNPVTQGVTVAWVGGGGYDFQSYGR
jgi:hypothetical protein